jgi:hypothetical protein
MSRPGSRRSAAARRCGPISGAGHLDLDALAWDVSEHLADLAMASARIKVALHPRINPGASNYRAVAPLRSKSRERRRSAVVSGY